MISSGAEVLYFPKSKRAKQWKLALRKRRDQNAGSRAQSRRKGQVATQFNMRTVKKRKM
jgi:hypothetical protein